MSSSSSGRGAASVSSSSIGGLLAEVSEGALLLLILASVDFEGIGRAPRTIEKTAPVRPPTVLIVLRATKVSLRPPAAPKNPAAIRPNESPLLGPMLEPRLRAELDL